MNVLGYLVVIVLVAAAVWGVTNQISGPVFASQFTGILAFAVIVLALLTGAIKLISPNRGPFN